MPEDWEEFTSLIRKMENIKKPQKTWGECWKFQWMRQCRAREEQRNTSRFRRYATEVLIDIAKGKWIHIPSWRRYSKIVRKRPRIPRTHSEAGTNRKEWRFQQRTSWWTRSLSTDRIHRWRGSPCRLLVNPRWLHLSSSHWTSSSTLRAEGRNIPYSTEIHWCYEVYSFRSGCATRKQIDDYWNVFLNKSLSDSCKDFTKFTIFKEKPWKGYMWSVERLTKIQTTLRPENVRKTRKGKRKTEARQCSKTERNLLYRSGWRRVQRNSQKREEENLKDLWPQPCRAKDYPTASRRWLRNQRLHPRRIPKQCVAEEWNVMNQSTRQRAESSLLKKKKTWRPHCSLRGYFDVAEVWTQTGKAAQNRETQEWKHEKPKLEEARRLRGIYFIDPEDGEY